MRKLNRFFLGTALALSLAVFGLLLGAWIGGKYLVSPGQGLAGPIEVLAYGALGAVVGLVIGIILAYVLRDTSLKIVTIVAFIPAVIVAFIAIRGILNNQADMDAALNEQIMNLPPFTLQLSHSEAVSGRPFVDVEYDSSRESYTATLPDGLGSGLIDQARI